MEAMILKSERDRQINPEEMRRGTGPMGAARMAKRKHSTGKLSEALAKVVARDKFGARQPLESDETLRKVRDVIDEQLGIPKDEAWLCYGKDTRLDVAGLKKKH